MTPEEHLAVPYVMVSESVPRQSGWVRKLSYPELPGVEAEAESVLDAYDLLEEKRVKYILERLEKGENVYVPRPPLRSSGLTAADRERLGFAKWLVDQKRVTEN